MERLGAAAQRVNGSTTTPTDGKSATVGEHEEQPTHPSPGVVGNDGAVGS